MTSSVTTSGFNCLARRKPSSPLARRPRETLASSEIGTSGREPRSHHRSPGWYPGSISSPRRWLEDRWLLCLRAFGYLCRDFGRKIYGKDGTLTRLTLDGNSALHQSDVPVTDGESQACPSVLPGYGDIRLGKLLK